MTREQIIAEIKRTAEANGGQALGQRLFTISRERNHGSADWRVASGSIMILCNHPDHDGAHVARVVTVWRRR